jgi:uncharacterized protein
MSTTPGPVVPSQPSAPEKRGLLWVFAGPGGLRAGWSIVLAYGLYYCFRLVVGTVFVTVNLVNDDSGFSAGAVALLELIPFLAMIGAGLIVGLVEQRRLLDYNLAGPRALPRFLLGFAAGFAALSALVGALRLGGWLRFGAAALSGSDALRLALLWACAYLLVGCVEEGLFRCYLQFTLTRGLTFWWALGLEIILCAYAYAKARSDAPGVYLVALLGLLPCFFLHRRAAARSAFWQAAWVSSTLFGLIHSFNRGENWIGIFAAASIGFVFCVSVRVTGSAWWAIGCHAAWDWSETYFYGTANSGIPAQGHLLTAGPVGNPLLSGGADGPEGSVLVFGAVLLLLFVLIALYGRRRPAAPASRELAAD